MTRFEVLGLCLLATCVARPVASATIQVEAPINSDFSVIVIEGDLQFGDEKKFIERVLKVEDSVVVLGSDGGKAIRLKGLKTLVPEGARCASACAIAWLAGIPRFMSPRAQVGFHAAYKLENGESKVSGSANALAGAYLNSLGLPDRAITYITSASPQGMTWLSFSDAEKVGIDVKQFDLPSDTTAERSKPSGPKTAAVEPPPAIPQPKSQGQEAFRPEHELLDLANPTHISRVQLRLQERGFFAGVVDGVWEAKSRIALLDFKISNGLGHDDEWDLRVQHALVDDRSRAAPAGYKPFGSGHLSPSRPQVAAIEQPTSISQPRLQPPLQPELEPQVSDLARGDAASQVQRRLQERGFFVGLVDGVWGPKSRVALRDFKTQSGLGADDSWSLPVQLALFDDSYPAAAIGYVPPDPTISTNGLFRPFSPVPGTTLHPLNPQDARVIQGALFQLGYYRKLGDGIWGEASRNALQDFRLANGLPADDVWDSSVLSLLTSGRAIPAIETPFGQWAKTGTSCADLSNPGRLYISAKEIIAGRGICRMERSLARSRDGWLGSAVCSRDGHETPARVALRIVSGQLIDQSTLGAVPNPKPPVFERCRF